MTRTTAPKKLTIRRLAVFLAAIGALVMSSGVALMATAGPAAAANKVGICHATNSDSNPYTFISVDDDSAKLQAHLAHRQSPNKTWKDAGTFNGVAHAAGAAKPDLIGSFTDDKGVFHQYDGTVTAATCQAAEVPSPEATADVDFTDPTCANKNEVSYDPTGSNVTFAITDGALQPGSSIEITATATGDSKFADNTTKQVFTHVFPAAVDLTQPPCVEVGPPDTLQDATANVTFTDATCDNSNTTDYATSGEHVSFAVTSGTKAPGQSIVVTATADEGHTFANGDPTKAFSHTFGSEVDLAAVPCVDVVEPPVVEPPVVQPPAISPVVTPTVVESGIVVPDLHSEQGLALLVAGGLLMLVAGGLVVAPATRRR